MMSSLWFPTVLHEERAVGWVRCVWEGMQRKIAKVNMTKIVTFGEINPKGNFVAPFSCLCLPWTCFLSPQGTNYYLISNIWPNTNTKPSIFWKAKTFPSMYCWIVRLLPGFLTWLNSFTIETWIIWLPGTSSARRLVSASFKTLRTCAPFMHRWLRWTQQESFCLSYLRKRLPSSAQVKKKKKKEISLLAPNGQVWRHVCLQTIL